MRVITARNVSTAFVSGLWHLKTEGVVEESRNGPVLVAPGPVLTEYRNPSERILWDPRRDANHVFHLMEAIWMFAGGRNVEWLLQFNSKFGQYAESDGNMWGAYGHRWRKGFGVDQILTVIDILKRDPKSRRAVIQMWCPVRDLDVDKRDVPCNTVIYFDTTGGKLNMTVSCRSNDMLWGAYGSNVVHFSMLLELVAHGAGLPMGVYRQFSNNFHVYTDVPMVKDYLENTPTEAVEVNIAPTPMFAEGETAEDFLDACEDLVNGTERGPFVLFIDGLVRELQGCYLTKSMSLGLNDWECAYNGWRLRRDI